MTYSTVIMLVLTLVAFSIFFLFVGKSSHGAILLEESTAKDIALALDRAEPEMKLVFNMSQQFSLARELGVSDLSTLVSLEDSVVFVSLSPDTLGASFGSFSTYPMDSYLDVGNETFVVSVKEDSFDA